MNTYTEIRYIEAPEQEHKRELARKLEAFGFYTKLCNGGLVVCAVNYEHWAFKYMPEIITAAIFTAYFIAISK